jgi:hypothetical protein
MRRVFLLCLRIAAPLPSHSASPRLQYPGSGAEAHSVQLETNVGVQV